MGYLPRLQTALHQNTHVGSFLRGAQAREVQMGARVLNVLVGLWLFVSAFAWPHTEAQLTVTWLAGVLCAVFALVAIQYPWVSYLNTVLALWLFLSSIVMPRLSPATTWNNMIAAIVIFILSLMPADVRPLFRRRSRTPA